VKDPHFKEIFVALLASFPAPPLVKTFLKIGVKFGVCFSNYAET